MSVHTSVHNEEVSRVSARCFCSIPTHHSLTTDHTDSDQNGNSTDVPAFIATQFLAQFYYFVPALDSFEQSQDHTHGTRFEFGRRAVLYYAYVAFTHKYCADRTRSRCVYKQH